MGPLLDQFRRKVEQIEDRVLRLGAKTLSKVRTQRVNYLDESGQAQTDKPSSWIRSYSYDKHTRSLFMTTKRGKTYEWVDVPPDIAIKVLNGMAECTTRDPSGNNDYFPGKTPSLGAAFWKYLKPFYRQQVHPFNTPKVQTGSYFDIATEGHEPKYNINVSKGKKPTKGQRDARDFGWAGRYKKGVNVRP